MNDLPIITQTDQSLRRAHCQYCGGKGDSLKAEVVRSPLGIGYRIPLSHASCKQSVLSLSLSFDDPTGLDTSGERRLLDQRSKE